MAAKYGDAISTAGPSARDIAATEAMTALLRTHNLFASREENQRREAILGQLSVLCKEWSKAVSIKKGLPEEIAGAVGAKVFTFGSYRLGVFSDGSDIDTLLVGPQHITRADFFAMLPDILRTNPGVTSITPVEDAYVPVLKLEFSGLSLDLLYASLAMNQIPDDLSLRDDNILRNIQDEQSVRSLNGSRVTDGILRLVPDIETFRMALRLVKHWGKQRGIYANKVGYLGGVSWALLVARTCQLYPNAAASTIVVKFFRVFYQWRWPDPVLLCPITPESAIVPPGLPVPSAYRVWNPKQYPGDGNHLMPIITPAFPSMNSTFNVSLSTLELMKAELTRGYEITKDLVDKPDAGEAAWEQLCERTDFFTRYKHYLQLEIVAANEDEYAQWEGWVESRLRFLVRALENTFPVWGAQPLLEHFTPPPSSPEQQQTSDTQKRSCCYIGLLFTSTRALSGQTGQQQQQPSQPLVVDLAPAVTEFKQIVLNWLSYRPGMDVFPTYLRRSQLPQFVIQRDAELAAKSRKRPAPDVTPSTSTSSTTPTSTTTTVDVTASPSNVRHLSPSWSASLPSVTPPAPAPATTSSTPSSMALEDPPKELIKKN